MAEHRQGREVPRNHQPDAVPAVDAGEVPAYKVGRVIRLNQSDVDAFIEGAKVQPGSLKHLYREAAPKGDEDAAARGRRGSHRREHGVRRGRGAGPGRHRPRGRGGRLVGPCLDAFAVRRDERGLQVLVGLGEEHPLGFEQPHRSSSTLTCPCTGLPFAASSCWSEPRRHRPCTHAPGPLTRPGP